MRTSPTLPRPGAPTEAPAKAGRKRLDIQGLRAIAVMAVVIDHVGVFHLPGGFVGVDVFFVISGFLITGHLVRGLASAGHVGFGEFYANRIRRLMPAATVVLIFSAVATVLFLPSTRWRDIAGDIVGSAFYVENWVLAESSVDYMTQDALPSPLQHFWSLAVEEQFYLLWPLVIALVGVALTLGSPASSRRRFLDEHPRRLQVGLLVGLAVIALPSLAWSVHLSDADPARAYFVTTTRLWELAIGGFIAILAVYFRRIPGAVAAAVMWAGLAGILASLVVIGPATPFPGVAALLPTLSTAAVIIGGFSAHRAGPAGLLSLRPVQLVGDWSYSIYLWHWPLIIIATAQLGEITVPIGLALIGVSLVAGYASYRWVETPTRNHPSWMATPAAMKGGLAMIVVSALVGLLVVGAPARENERDAAETQRRAAWQIEAAVSGDPDAVKLGATVLPDQPEGAEEGAPRDSFPELIPAPAYAPRDFVPCTSSRMGDPTVRACPFPTPGATLNVALVGDSHAAQWLAALLPMAEKNGWNVTAYIHNMCPFAAGELLRGGKRYADCIEWNETVTAELLEQDLAAVITSNYTNGAAVAGGVERMAAAHAAAWAPFTARQIPVVVIRDSPRPRPIHVAECAALHEDSLTQCAFPREKGAEHQGVAQMLAARGMQGVTAVDLNYAICPTQECAAAIGGVLVYRDTDHLSGTYVRTLQPRLEKAFRTIESLRGAATPTG